MTYLLDAVYLLLVLATLPWTLYSAIRFGKYREGWGQKFFGRVPLRSGDCPCVWLHGVSVGEINLLAVLIRRIEDGYPDVECVISTTTRTGHELAKSKYPNHLVFYCPLDFSWAVRNAIRRVKPNLIVLGELELWPNLISFAKRHDVPVAIVNARLSDTSFRRYLRIRPFIGRTLAQIDLIAVQTQTYGQRFKELGALEHKTFISGSLKFDGASMNRENPRSLEMRRLAGIEPADVVFLAGSTQHPEEQLVLTTFSSLVPQFPNLRLILVPRHAERFESVARLLDESGLDWTRRSTLEPSRGSGTDARIMLVDTIGELSAWWGVASIAFVGGSLGNRGGQNMIEPTAYGAAVSFGPSTRNFRDIVQLLLDADAAKVVKNGDELTSFVRECLERPSDAVEMGRRAQIVVRENMGALDRTMKRLGPLIDESCAAEISSSQTPVRRIA